jgi:hypothetical protein
MSDRARVAEARVAEARVAEASPATRPGAVPGAAATAVPPSPGGPVIVLTYAHAGAPDLMRMLSASRTLACTAGTGLLNLCADAAATWQRVENRAAPSALAVRSIRGLVGTMAMVLQSGAGASRWCETAFAQAPVADTFAQVFPDASFLCLHRNLPGVMADGVASHPWGLGNSPFWTHSGPHPGNNAETIGSYWAARATQLLDFEARHQPACLRVRHEDLLADPRGQATEIFSRLHLDGGDAMTPVAVPDLLTEAGQASPGPPPPLPADRMTPELMGVVRELCARLDYPLG